MQRRHFLAGAAWPFAPDDSDLWRAGEGGYHTYRIPAAVRTRRGAILAFCEGRRGSASDTGDIDVLLRRAARPGAPWSETRVIANFGSDTVGNPAPVVDRREGAVHLLLTRNPGRVTEKEIVAGTAPETRTVWTTVSRDEGLTWSEPRDITAQVKRPDWNWYATGPCNGIQLRTGRLLIPCDHIASGGAMGSHVIYSDDRGRTWQIGGTVGPQCNESTVAELAAGELLLNMRSYRGDHRRLVSRSRDSGLTWTPPAPDDALVEPVCQASLLRVGRTLLFSNPAAETRRNLTVKSSPDGGRTWRDVAVIHPGPSAYSNLVALDRGRVGLLYECGDRSPYERIAWTTFSLSPRHSA